jgi:hypothetical protein
MAHMVEVKVPDIGDFDEVAVIEVLVKVGDTVKRRAVADHGGVGQGLDGNSFVACRRHQGAAREGGRQGERGLRGADAGCGGRRRGARRRQRRPRLPPQRHRSRPRRPHKLRPRHRATPVRSTSNAICWCWVPAPAATRPPSARPTWASRWCWSSAMRRWAASASTSAAFRRRRLLHVAAVIDEVKHFADLGVSYGEPKVDRAKLLGRKNKVVGKLTGGLSGDGEDAQGDDGARHRRVRRPVPRQGAGNHGRRQGDHRQGADGQVPALCHRGRLAGRASALHAQGPAGGGFDRRAGTRRRSQAHADPRRRHHRPRDGLGLLHAGRAARRGRDARRPDAGRRPRPGQGLAEAQCAALRQHHAEDQDGRRRGHQGRHPRQLRRRAGPQGGRSSTTWCCRPWAAAPTARRSVPRRRA